jgi:hypothetical protein
MTNSFLKLYYPPIVIDIKKGVVTMNESKQFDFAKQQFLLVLMSIRKTGV